MGSSYRKKDDTDEINRKMKTLYESGLTLEEVGRGFGMTRQAVRDRFIKAGIERRPRTRTIDKNRLEKLYCQDRVTLSDIAAEFRVNLIKVKEALENYNIPRREPLKLGGYIVGFLRNLEIGKTEILELPPGKKYIKLRRAAKLAGIEISYNCQKSGRYEVTRTA